MQSKESYKELIRDIILNGTAGEKAALFSFNSTHSEEEVAKKFELFTRTKYTRYFKNKSSDDHREIVKHLVSCYRGSNEVEAGYRGLAKTALAKLFLVFVLLNDEEQHRKYIKVISKDLKNAKTFVTDVYNMMVEASDIYGDVFMSEGKIKREETMGAFRLTDKKDPNSASGIMVSCGTIGQDQRGNLQDAFRPDWIIFEDIEDATSISSRVQTQNNLLRAQEALDGLDPTGSYLVNCNYISEDGLIQWFMDKDSTNVHIYPIATDVVYGKNEKGKRTVESATSAWVDRFPLEKIQDICLDAEDWFGEYMTDPAHSDDKFFSIERINEDIKKAIPPKYESAGVRYWGSYISTHRYGQASDHSEGIGKDSNTIAGFDFNTGELIYTYANNTVDPIQAAHECIRTGREYGNCVWAMETNNRCGGTVITTAKAEGYSNIFQKVIEDKRNPTITNQLGWYTTANNKNTAFMEFRDDYNEGNIIIYDVDVLKEMKAYTNNDLSDSSTGLITRHFDLLMAVVIAWQMQKYAKAVAKPFHQPESDVTYSDIGL